MQIDSIRYIDSFAYKTSHLQVNAGFMKMLSIVYDKIEYSGSKECLSNINKLLVTDAFNDLPKRFYPVIKGTGKLHLLYRYIRSLIINIIELLFSNKNQILFYNFNNVFSISIINNLNKILKRKIIILCHGELELLRADIKKEGFLQQVLMSATRSFFNKKTKFSKDILFIVLGESILDNLKIYLTQNQLQQFIAIDHPYIFSTQILVQDNKDKILNIGTIGSLSEFKGGSRLVKLANLVKSDADLKNKIIISVVGQVFMSRQDLINANVVLADSTDGEIPMNTFNEMAENLDYMLFLYDRDSYQLTASGALFDSVKYGKPFISINNSYFSYITRKYNIPGYIIDKVDDIPVILKSILRNGDTKSSYDDIRIQLSPEYLAKELKNKLQRVETF